MAPHLQGLPGLRTNGTPASGAPRLFVDSLVQGDEHPANCGRATWRRLREVADPDGGQGIGLWASGLEPVCSSGSR